MSSRVVPNTTSHSKMRACMSCSLIKTVAQFVSDGCENCNFMGYQQDRERVNACTTSAFVGAFVSIKPRTSWVAKWQRVASFVPGAYAISIDARIPDDIVEQLEENRLRPHAVLATTRQSAS